MSRVSVSSNILLFSLYVTLMTAARFRKNVIIIMTRWLNAAVRSSTQLVAQKKKGKKCQRKRKFFSFCLWLLQLTRLNFCHPTTMSQWSKSHNNAHSRRVGGKKSITSGAKIEERKYYKNLLSFYKNSRCCINRIKKKYVIESLCFYFIQHIS